MSKWKPNPLKPWLHWIEKESDSRIVEVEDGKKKLEILKRQEKENY